MSHILEKICLILGGAAAVWFITMALIGPLTVLIFGTVDDGSYIPGRDTTTFWADGKIEILRGHDFETGEEQYYLYIEHSSAENGHVRAYRRTGNPVQVLVENRLYTIDESTLTYTVQTLSDEEIPALTRGFRRLKP